MDEVAGRACSPRCPSQHAVFETLGAFGAVCVFSGPVFMCFVHRIGNLLVSVDLYHGQPELKRISRSRIIGICSRSRLWNEHLYGGVPFVQRSV